MPRRRPSPSTTSPPTSTPLRQSAEAQLNASSPSPAPAPSGSEASNLRLLHELQVHQIELELQNAELQEARERLVPILDRYTDLYEFAPVGYLTIDFQLKIQESNLTATTLLGVNRSHLLLRPFLQFVVPQSHAKVRQFLRSACSTPGSHECEVDLIHRIDGVFAADLHVIKDPLGDGCRIAISNVSALKRVREMQRLMQTLTDRNDEMRQEIVRREAVEAALKQSEAHQIELLERSRQMQDQLRHLSHRILQAEEDERRRISRELHDDVLQTMVGINVHLENLSHQVRLDPVDLQQRIASVREIISGSVQSVHRFARELRPLMLDDLGLLPALETALAEFRSRNAVRTRFSANPEVENLSSLRRTVIYRVVQAALNNIDQHAKATSARVTLRHSAKSVVLQIHDNGKSFDVAHILDTSRYRRLGVLGMRERVEMVGGEFLHRIRGRERHHHPGHLSPRPPSSPAKKITAQKKTSPARRKIMSRPIRVLLADDHTVVREGFRALLAAETDIVILGEAENGRVAVELARRHQPDVIVMDITMPLLNGLEASRQILHSSPNSQILILSAHEDDAYLRRALDVGVAGYLNKQTSATMFLAAVRTVAGGRAFFCPSVARRLEILRSAPRPPNSRTFSSRRTLTPREAEVLQLIAEGLANKQTAAELGISIKTVEKHRQHIMDKLDVHDTASLTRHALAMGLIKNETSLH